MSSYSVLGSGVQGVIFRCVLECFHFYTIRDRYYRTRSNYPNVLITQTALFNYFIPSYFIEHINFQIYLLVLFNQRKWQVDVTCKAQAQDMATDEENAEFVFPSAIRGFHVYRRVWVPRLGQRFCSEREHGNTGDRFAVAVVQHRSRSLALLLRGYKSLHLCLTLQVANHS